MQDFSWPDLLALVADDANDEHGSAAWAEVRRRLSVLVHVVQRGIPALTNEDAEDIVQQTIVQMKGNRTTFHTIRTATAPNAYLLRLVRNAAIDTVRRTSRLAPLEDRASSTLEQSDVAIDVQAVLGMLSAEEREMVVMHFWEGMSLAQIALTKRLPYSTVAKRFFRLMSRLKTQIGEQQ